VVVICTAPYAVTGVILCMLVQVLTSAHIHNTL